MGYSENFDLRSLISSGDSGGDWVDNTDAKDLLKSPELIKTIRDYYRTKGQFFETDQEAINAFYSDQVWRRMNVGSALKHAFNSATEGDEEQIKREALLSRAYDKMPDFGEEGGMSGMDALREYGSAAISDPTNYIPGMSALKAVRGAGTALSTGRAAWEGAKRGALSEGLISGGAGVVQDVAQQSSEKSIGLRDEIDLGQTAVVGGFSAGAGLGIGGLIGGGVGIHANNQVKALLNNGWTTSQIQQLSHNNPSVIGKYVRENITPKDAKAAGLPAPDDIPANAGDPSGATTPATSSDPAKPNPTEPELTGDPIIDRLNRSQFRADENLRNADSLGLSPADKRALERDSDQASVLLHFHRDLNELSQRATSMAPENHGIFPVIEAMRGRMNKILSRSSSTDESLNEAITLAEELLEVRADFDKEMASGAGVATAPARPAAKGAEAATQEGATTAAQQQPAAAAQATAQQEVSSAAEEAVVNDIEASVHSPATAEDEETITVGTKSAPRTKNPAVDGLVTQRLNNETLMERYTAEDGGQRTRDAVKDLEYRNARIAAIEKANEELQNYIATVQEAVDAGRVAPRKGSKLIKSAENKFQHRFIELESDLSAPSAPGGKGASAPIGQELASKAKALESTRAKLNTWTKTLADDGGPEVKYVAGKRPEPRAKAAEPEATGKAPEGAETPEGTPAAKVEGETPEGAPAAPEAPSAPPVRPSTYRDERTMAFAKELGVSDDIIVAKGGHATRAFQQAIIDKLRERGIDVPKSSTRKQPGMKAFLDDFMDNRKDELAVAETRKKADDGYNVAYSRIVRELSRQFGEAGLKWEDIPAKDRFQAIALAAASDRGIARQAEKTGLGDDYIRGFQKMVVNELFGRPEAPGKRPMAVLGNESNDDIFSEKGVRREISALRRDGQKKLADKLEENVNKRYTEFRAMMNRYTPIRAAESGKLPAGGYDEVADKVAAAFYDAAGLTTAQREMSISKLAAENFQLAALREQVEDLESLIRLGDFDEIDDHEVWGNMMYQFADDEYGKLAKKNLDDPTGAESATRANVGSVAGRVAAGAEEGRAARQTGRIQAFMKRSSIDGQGDSKLAQDWREAEDLRDSYEESDPEWSVYNEEARVLESRMNSPRTKENWNNPKNWEALEESALEHTGPRKVVRKRFNPETGQEEVYGEHTVLIGKDAAISVANRRPAKAHIVPGSGRKFFPAGSKNLRVIVAGGRDYAEKADDMQLLSNILGDGVAGEIVSGKAEGADALGERWASGNGVKITEFPADWKGRGKAAGPERNARMADYADAVILFPGGRGTANMRTLAREKGLHIIDLSESSSWVDFDASAFDSVSTYVERVKMAEEKIASISHDYVDSEGKVTTYTGQDAVDQAKAEADVASAALKKDPENPLLAIEAEERGKVYSSLSGKLNSQKHNIRKYRAIIEYLEANGREEGDLLATDPVPYVVAKGGETSDVAQVRQITPELRGTFSTYAAQLRTHEHNVKTGEGPVLTPQRVMEITEDMKELRDEKLFFGREHVKAGTFMFWDPITERSWPASMYDKMIEMRTFSVREGFAANRLADEVKVAEAAMAKRQRRRLATLAEITDQRVKVQQAFNRLRTKRYLGRDGSQQEAIAKLEAELENSISHLKTSMERLRSDMRVDDGVDISDEMLDAAVSRGVTFEIPVYEGTTNKSPWDYAVRFYEQEASVKEKQVDQLLVRRAEFESQARNLREAPGVDPTVRLREGDTQSSTRVRENDARKFDGMVSAVDRHVARLRAEIAEIRGEDGTGGAVGRVKAAQTRGEDYQPLLADVLRKELSRTVAGGETVGDKWVPGKEQFASAAMRELGVSPSSSQEQIEKAMQTIIFRGRESGGKKVPAMIESFDPNYVSPTADLAGVPSVPNENSITEFTKKAEEFLGRSVKFEESEPRPLDILDKLDAGDLDAFVNLRKAPGLQQSVSMNDAIRNIMAKLKSQQRVTETVEASIEKRASRERPGYVKVMVIKSPHIRGFRILQEIEGKDPAKVGAKDLAVKGEKVYDPNQWVTGWVPENLMSKDFDDLARMRAFLPDNEADQFYIDRHLVQGGANHVSGSTGPARRKELAQAVPWARLRHEKILPELTEEQLDSMTPEEMDAFTREREALNRNLRAAITYISGIDTSVVPKGYTSDLSELTYQDLHVYIDALEVKWPKHVGEGGRITDSMANKHVQIVGATMEEISGLEKNVAGLDADDFRQHITHLTTLYRLRAIGAPHGINADEVTKEASLAQLDEVIKGADEETIAVARKILSSILEKAGRETGPTFSAGKGFNTRTGLSQIPDAPTAGDPEITLYQGLDSGDGVLIPKIQVFAHEIGHWAYTHLLTDNERLYFWENVFGGGMDLNRMSKYGSKEEGLFINPNEYFAQNFERYMMGLTPFKDRMKDQSWWQKIVNNIYSLIGFRASQVPPDPELVPLFRRILPESELSMTDNVVEIGEAAGAGGRKRKSRMTGRVAKGVDAITDKKIKIISTGTNADVPTRWAKNASKLSEEYDFAMTDLEQQVAMVLASADNPDQVSVEAFRTAALRMANTLRKMSRYRVMKNYDRALQAASLSLYHLLGRNEKSARPGQLLRIELSERVKDGHENYYRFITDGRDPNVETMNFDPIKSISMDATAGDIAVLEDKAVLEDWLATNDWKTNKAMDEALEEVEKNHGFAAAMAADRTALQVGGLHESRFSAAHTGEDMVDIAKVVDAIMLRSISGEGGANPPLLEILKGAEKNLAQAWQLRTNHVENVGWAEMLPERIRAQYRTNPDGSLHESKGSGVLHIGSTGKKKKKNRKEHAEKVAKEGTPNLDTTGATPDVARDLKAMSGLRRPELTKVMAEAMAKGDGRTAVIAYAALHRNGDPSKIFGKGGSAAMSDHDEWPTSRLIEIVSNAQFNEDGSVRPVTGQKGERRLVQNAMGELRRRVDQDGEFRKSATGMNILVKDPAPRAMPTILGPQDAFERSVLLEGDEAPGIPVVASEQMKEILDRVDSRDIGVLSDTRTVMRKALSLVNGESPSSQMITVGDFDRLLGEDFSSDAIVGGAMNSSKVPQLNRVRREIRSAINDIFSDSPESFEEGVTRIAKIALRSISHRSTAYQRLAEGSRIEDEIVETWLSRVKSDPDSLAKLPASEVDEVVNELTGAFTHIVRDTAGIEDELIDRLPSFEKLAFSTKPNHPGKKPGIANHFASEGAQRSFARMVEALPRATVDYIDGFAGAGIGRSTEGAGVPVIFRPVESSSRSSQYFGPGEYISVGPRAEMIAPLYHGDMADLIDAVDGLGVSVEARNKIQSNLDLVQETRDVMRMYEEDDFAFEDLSKGLRQTLRRLEIMGVPKKHLRNSDVEPVAVRVTNPLDLRADASMPNWFIEEFSKLASTKDRAVTPDQIRAAIKKASDDAGRDAYEAMAQAAGSYSAATRILEKMGYDGIRFTGVGVNPHNNARFNYDSYVVFDRRNVKPISELEDEVITTVDPNTAVTSSTPSQDFIGSLLDDLGSRPMVSLLGAQEGVMRGAAKSVTNAYKTVAKKTFDPKGLKDMARHGPSFYITNTATRIAKHVGDTWYSSWLRDQFARHDMVLASKVMPIIRQANKLPGSGGMFKRWVRSSSPMFGKKRTPTESEARVIRALRWGNPADLIGEEQTLYRTIRSAFEAELDKLKQLGIMRFDGIRDYFPQVWDPAKISRNQEQFKDILKRYLREEHEIDGLERKSDEEIEKTAERMMLTLIDTDGVHLPAPHSTSRNPDAPNIDQQRMIRLHDANLKAKFLPEMQEFMEDDLSAIVTKYFDTSTRRINYAEKWGASSHGFYAYTQILDAADAKEEAAKLLRTDRLIRRRRRGLALEADDVTSVDDFNTVPQSVQITRKIPSPFNDETRAKVFVADLMRLMKNDPVHGKAAALRMARTAHDFPLSPDKQKEWDFRAQAIVEGLYTRELTMDGKPIHDTEIDRMHQMFRVGQRKVLNIDTPNASVNLRISKAVRNFNAVTLLGFTTLTSFTDVALPLLRSGDMKAWLNGMSQFAKDPEYREMMRNTGLAVENYVHNRMVHLYGSSSGKFTTAFFNATMLTPWTDRMREMSGIVGMEWLKAEQRRLMKHGANSVPGRKAMKILREFGLEHYVGPNAPAIESSIRTAADGTKEIADEAVKMALLKFANESIFTPNPGDIPLWLQGPGAAMMFQLKSFPLMMARQIGKPAIMGMARAAKAAVKGDFSQLNEALPMLYMMTIAQGFGAASLAMKDIIQVRGGEENREAAVRERKLSADSAGLGRILGFDEDTFDGDEDEFLGWYLESMLHVGGFGIFADLLHSAVEHSDNGAYGSMRFMSTIGGPVAGDLFSVANLMQGAAQAVSDEEANGAVRHAVREVVGRTPVAGGVRGLREAAVDAIAGEPTSGRGGKKSSLDIGSFAR